MLNFVGASRHEEIITNNSELGEAISENNTMKTPNLASKAGIAACVRITKKQATARKLFIY